MAIYYLDSSALVKRYVAETGSAWVKSLFGPATTDQTTIADITGAEIVSAISRKLRSGGISGTDATNALRRFRSDYAHDFDLINISGSIIADAMHLAEVHALRGYDAIQLAAARAALRGAQLLGNPMFLVSADSGLNRAAVLEGIAVEDPNTHP